MLDSSLPRDVEGPRGVARMFSCRVGAVIRGRVSMVMGWCCWGCVVLGLGFWKAVMRLEMAKIGLMVRVKICDQAGPEGRSMSEKRVLRRVGNP